MDFLWCQLITDSSTSSFSASPEPHQSTSKIHSEKDTMLIWKVGAINAKESATQATSEDLNDQRTMYNDLKYTNDFVLKVNETWHDVEASHYDTFYSYFEEESMRWKKVLERFFTNNSQSLVLLDIGSGTGFIPLQVAPFLKKDDLLICSDISENMLDVCKEKISEKEFKCNFEYLKLNGHNINLASNTLDYITINAVLHHVPNLSILFKETNRLLKINGRMIIGCEPNKFFYEHKFLWNNYKIISLIFDPQQFILGILRRLNLFEVTRSLCQNFNQRLAIYNSIIEEVNDRLLKERIIKTPMTADKLAKIVDIQSPTAGGYTIGRGIDMNAILRESLTNVDIEYFETYEHLCKATFKNKFTRWYDSFLKKKYPNTGATLFLVLKKIGF